MYIVREVFIAKPGQASKLAKLFKKAFKNYDATIMTDMVGMYNKVVVEMNVKSLTEFEKQMEDYRTGKAMHDMDPEVVQQMSTYTELYTTGKREIYRIEE